MALETLISKSKYSRYIAYVLSLTILALIVLNWQDIFPVSSSIIILFFLIFLFNGGIGDNTLFERLPFYLASMGFISWAVLIFLSTDQLIVKVLILLLLFYAFLVIIGLTLGWKKVSRMSLKCPNCGHIFKPLFSRSFLIFFFIPGSEFCFPSWIGPVFTRCPKCGKRSWQKVIEDTRTEGK